MKKILLALLMFAAILACSGCDARVHNYELQGYAQNYQDHGGVMFINNFRTQARCMDGTWVGSIPED